MQILIWILVFLLLGVAGTIIYDSNRFRKVSYEIVTPEIGRDFHFLFLSDLHNKKYGENNEKLLAAIEACAPDAILIGGDILTASPGQPVADAAELVKKLADKYPLYYANGNHEQRLVLYPDTYGDMGSEYERLLREAGVTRLVNSSVTDEVHGVQIAGCEIDRRFYKRFQRVSMPDEYPGEILPPKRPELFTILLAHNPDYFKAYRAWGADLVLSGHVHGGVMRLPLFGGVLGTNFRPFPKYDGGRFDEEGSVMIVSRGLGAHTIPLRLFNPAELVEIYIKKEE